MGNFISTLIDNNMLSTNDYEKLLRRWREGGKSDE